VTFPYKGVYFILASSHPDSYCTKLSLSKSIKKWETEFLPIPTLGTKKTFTWGSGELVQLVTNKYAS
jgi:hypothetical protein